jgi:fused signal recognition particle receptor
MFKFLKEVVSDSYNKIKECFNFDIKNVDTVFLEKNLLEQNFMPDLVKKLIELIKNDMREDKEVLKEALLKIFENNKNIILSNKSVFILVGINGSGKTTTAIKLARAENTKFKTLLVPADTFRAAAKEQLHELAAEYNINFFNHQYEQPAMVIFKAAEYFNQNNYEKIIIDTAGRIHQNDALIRELVKSVGTAKKQFQDKEILTVLVLDGLQGKNLLEQVKLFNNAISVDGIVLTKLDAGVKPGIIFSIVDTLKIPILYLGVGQKDTDLIKFDPVEFVEMFFK